MKRNKKHLKKIVSVALVLSMIFSMAACSKNSDSTKTDNKDQSSTNVDPTQGAKDENVTEYSGEIELLVDLHGWMPTLNTEPTAENPTVFRSPQDIADKFNELYPNITIKWARNKPVGGLQTELAEWFTTQINAGTVPAIAFSWGTQYQDRDWYLPLDEYLDTPNEFVEGNTKWRDLFPEYLWTNGTVANANKQVVAIPIALYPGPATGYFYNKTAFSEAGLTSVPTTWEELIEASKKLKEAGYTGVSPTSILPNIQFAAWVEQFSLGPYLSAGIMDETDFDGNEKVDTLEQVRGVKAGVYNPVDKPYAQELFKQIKRYYTEVLETGWESTDYTTAWNEGKVGFREDGMWILQSENSNKSRSFDYGVFPAPPISSDTTPYAGEVSYTEKGPYQPDPDLQLNIMKDAVEGKPEVLDAAIKFLKFLTTPENNSAMILEQGSDIGAIKGAEVPPILGDWLNQSFAIVPKTNWPGAFTEEQSLALDKNLELWVKGSMGDDEFFKKINEIQQQGADDYIERMNIDTSGW
jgi:raffinose/stachyose/melibiose transport system substrate-binding protein